MYIYIYTYVYVYIYTHYIYIYIHICIYIYIRYICIYIYIYIYTHVYTYVQPRFNPQLGNHHQYISRRSAEMVSMVPPGKRAPSGGHQGHGDPLVIDDIIYIYIYRSSLSTTIDIDGFMGFMIFFG